MKIFEKLAGQKALSGTYVVGAMIVRITANHVFSLLKAITYPSAYQLGDECLYTSSQTLSENYANPNNSTHFLHHGLLFQTAAHTFIYIRIRGLKWP